MLTALVKSIEIKFHGNMISLCTVFCMLVVSHTKILNGTHVKTKGSQTFSNSYKVSDWLFFTCKMNCN